MRRNLLIGFMLAALTLGVYWPTLTHEFICYDDPEFITENPQIQSGLNWGTIVYAFTRPVVGNWHPVTTLSHALDCGVWGVNPWGHHLMSMLIHATNALLLFLVLQSWLTLDRCGPNSNQRKRPLSSSPGWGDWIRAALPSLLVAIVFALHPLRVESVAWVAERKDVLSGLFFVLTLWMYSLFVQRSSAFHSGGGIFYGAALLSFALGLMSKPMLVTVPFVLLLLDYWPLGRLRISDFGSQVSNFRRLALEKVPFLALAILDCWITLDVQKSAGAMQVIGRVTWSERLANAITSYTRYLGKLFWPTDLAIIYPHPAKHYYLSDQWPDWEIAVAFLLLVMISVWCISQLRRRPYLAVGWFWYLGMMMPVIGLIQVGEQAMADRYTYLALIGPVLALVCWLRDLLEVGGTPTIHRRPEERIETQGATVLEREECQGPVSALSGSGRGLGASTPSIWAAAAVAALAVLLGLLTRQQLGYWQNSVTLFDYALAVTADNASAQFAMGVGLEKQGEIAKAMVHYRMAVGIDPNYGKAYYNMGQILRKQGRWQPAADAYFSALRVRPNDAATELNLASVLPHLQRAREAVTHFEHALLLDPDSIEGLNNLAWLRATCVDSQVRDGSRAVQLAERACSLAGSKMPVLLGTLAAAYAEAGRFTEAVTTASNASALAAQIGDSATASKNQELMGLYRANRAYRETQ
jgi:protein O-mannosyl-transferase